MRTRNIIILFIFIFAFSFSAFSQTSDDYYNRGVNKYFLGDEVGAIKELEEALRIDPNNTKARELLNEIRKELGEKTTTTTTAKPTTTVAAPPAPFYYIVPQVIQPAPKIVKPLEKKPAKIEKKKEEKAEEKKPAAVFIPQKPSGVTAPFIELTIWDKLWIIVALLTILYIVIRLFSIYFSELRERLSYQICSECKYANSREAEFCAKCGARLKPWVGVTAAQRKWYAKFNWKKNPFTLDIMPKLFTGYQTQVNTIFDKVYLKTGHILVLGNKGVGKTTLLKWLADVLSKEFNTVYIPRPTDNFEDLLTYLAQSLKIKKGRGGKITIYDMEALVGKTSRNILLLLDEAHEFNKEFERPLRTLGDLNGVFFIIAGLPEAREKIKRDSPPFYDRIIQEVVLQHLTLEETTELIRKRIEDAGGSGLAPFTPEAIENIFKMSKGIPRVILKVCDWVIADAIHNNLEVIQVTETSSFPQAEIEEETEGEGKA